jgi:hypothetical protein
MLNKSVGVIVITILFVHSLPNRCKAGDATFSNDGRHIYITTSDGSKPALRDIDLTSQTSRTISLTQLPKDEFVVGISRSPWDKIPLLTRSTIWALDPRSGKLSKIRSIAKNGNFFRIAYNPKTREVYVTTNEGLFLLKNGKDMVEVFVRRHNAVGCPVFSAGGDMFFAENGDLWHGQIEVEEGRYSLNAYRYAPLGALETANTTPNETGVRDIAVARDAIFVHLARLGGSGWGSLAQIARPPGAGKPEDFGASVVPAERLPMYKTALDSVKILGENGGAANLCMSPDETRVYYSKPVENSNQPEDWLVTDGTAQQLHLRSQ